MKRAALFPLLIGCLFVAGSVYAERSGQDASGLEIPNSAFSPATTSGPTVVPNSVANRGYFNWLHTVSYTSLHRITGVGEDAQWHPVPASRDIVEFLYLGSIFRSSSDAATAYADSITYAVSQYGAALQACPRGLPLRCKRLQLAVSGPPASTQWHDVFALGPCLVEVSADRPNAFAATPNVTNQTLKTLDAVDRAARHAAQKTCRPSQQSGKFGFTLTRVAILDRQGHARGSFKVLEPFVISISWKVQHLKGTATATITFLYQVPNGSRWKTAASGRERIVTTNGVNPYQKETQFTTAGKFRIAVTVTIKSLSKFGTATVIITR
jgi:hypothetical protein